MKPGRFYLILICILGGVLLLGVAVWFVAGRSIPDEPSSRVADVATAANHIAPEEPAAPPARAIDEPVAAPEKNSEPSSAPVNQGPPPVPETVPENQGLPPTPEPFVPSGPPPTPEPPLVNLPPPVPGN